MTARRHHYIPQFLLRNFASRRQSQKRWVIQFTRESEPREISTRDAAVARDFYGVGDDTLERALSAHESEHAVVVAKVLGGEDPQRFGEALGSMIRLLAYRSRMFREGFLEGASGALREIASTATRENISNFVEQNFERVLEDMRCKMPGLPPEQQQVLQPVLSEPALVAELKRQFARHCRTRRGAEGLASVIRQVLEGVDLATVVPKSHNESMSRSLPRGLALTKSGGVYWSVLRARSNSVILGDNVAIAFPSEGSPGHLSKHNTAWSEIYAPIAHDTILVASRTDDPPGRGLNEINAAAAGTSQRCFFASCDGTAWRDLASRIGAEGPLLSEEDVKRASQGVWDASISS
ncbi:MAG: DUF4238 domain-containing protein [Phycisphaeraceae bacterium]|nr:DUF4238 domain-containing protein [Phycisphaeraceae bacterium]